MLDIVVKNATEYAPNKTSKFQKATVCLGKCDKISKFDFGGGKETLTRVIGEIVSMVKKSCFYC